MPVINNFFVCAHMCYKIGMRSKLGEKIEYMDVFISKYIFWVNKGRKNIYFLGCKKFKWKLY